MPGRPTARTQVLDAMVRLERRHGRETFQLADIVQEVLTTTDRYPESTLRAQITSVMCANAPVNHANHTDDLERMAHGQYRRVVPWGDAVASPAEVRPPSTQEPTAPVDRHQHWAWEGNVQASAATALAASGWQLRSVVNTATREHGADIVADRDGRRLLIEVKGYPDGSTSANTQARHLFAGALLAGVLMPEADPDAAIVLVFPEYKTYENLVRRTTGTLRTLGIGVISIAESGAATEHLAPRDGPILVPPGPGHVEQDTGRATPGSAF